MKTSTDRPWLVLGAGGHAAVVVDALLRSGARVLGVVTPDLVADTLWEYDLPVLGGDDILGQYGADDIYLALGLGGYGGNKTRRELFLQCRRAGFDFPPVIHPDATVAAGVSLGAGSQVMAGAVIQARALLQDAVIVNTSASVDHDSRVGHYCHIAPHACLCGGVILGSSVHVGPGAVVIQEIEITADSFVKAGSCISKSL